MTDSLLPFMAEESGQYFAWTLPIETAADGLCCQSKFSEQGPEVRLLSQKPSETSITTAIVVITDESVLKVG